MNLDSYYASLPEFGFSSDAVGLRRALDESPGDVATMRILADCLMESGMAEGWIALAMLDRVPWIVLIETVPIIWRSSEFVIPWGWWPVDSDTKEDQIRQVGSRDRSGIGRDWHGLINGRKGAVLMGREFPSRLHAEIAAVNVWGDLPELVRNHILQGRWPGREELEHAEATHGG